MPASMIEVGGLVKIYGSRETIPALNNISFTVNKGWSFGILGSRGAGKTTLLRILATTLSPTEGNVRVGGHDVLNGTSGVRGRIGYAPENVDLRSWRAGIDYLRFWGRASGLASAEREARIEEVLGFLELREEVTEEVGSYTIELQRRLALAQSLLTDPDVLLLDEPLVGLGTGARRFLADRLVELRTRGKTIILSSSLLADIRATCDHVAVMSGGMMTKVFGTAELLTKIGEGRDARIFVDCDPLGADAIAALREIRGVVDARSSESANLVYVKPGEVTPEEVREVLEAQGVKVKGVRMAELKLGDVFSTLHT